MDKENELYSETLINDDFKFEIKRLDNNQVIPCELLFTTSRNNIDYIVYTDNKYDENDNLNILAARYEEKDGKTVLLNIETDEEFDFLDKEIEERFG